MTKRELWESHAEANGLDVRQADYAIPQSWLDNAADQSAVIGLDREEAYYTLYSGIVWYYGDYTFGRPLPLTKDAADILNAIGWDYQ
jgi:hypothetical protein